MSGVAQRGRVLQRAFTLLEVLVAVAVLGLGLTIILSAQTGMVTSSRRAQTMSFAVGLARCKMNEVEEQVLREGFSLTAEDEEGPCCDDDDSSLKCVWSIVPVELPDLEEGGFGGGADAGAGEGAGEGSLGALGNAQDSLMGGDTSGALSELVGGGSGGPSMGAGALAPLAMGLIYPQLKTMLEASIRKVTVRVVWSEGKLERDLSVTQYLTNPQQGGLMDVDESAGAEGVSPPPTPSPGRGPR
jgi:general secretion pathway protein I